MKIFLALLFACGIQVQAHAEKWKVIEVVSGDSFRATSLEEPNTPRMLRLSHITSPDKWAKPLLWEEAKKHLASLLSPGSIVEVKHVREGSTNVYVALDEKSINLAMVKSGYGWYQPSTPDSPVLAKAQEEAKANKRGLWGIMADQVTRRALISAFVETIEINLFDDADEADERCKFHFKISPNDEPLDGTATETVSFTYGWDMPRTHGSDTPQVRWFFSFTSEIGETFLTVRSGQHRWIRSGGNFKHWKVGAARAGANLNARDFIPASTKAWLASVVSAIERVIGHGPSSLPAFNELTPASRLEAKSACDWRLYLEKKESQLEMASEAWSFFYASNDVNWVFQRTTLHFSVSKSLGRERRELVAVEMPGGGPLIFWHREAFDRHVANHKVKEVAPLLVEVTRGPLTEKDEALFKLPEAAEEETEMQIRVPKNGDTDTKVIKVLSVLDGSTIEGTIEGQQEKKTIRLFGIAAPIKDEGVVQPFWKESKEFLEEKIGGKTVVAEFRPGKNESLAIIKLNRDYNLNFEMIRSGHAWYQPDHGNCPMCEKVQRDAKEAKKGLWGRPEAPVEPWKYKEFLKARFFRIADFYGGADQLKKQLHCAKLTCEVVGTPMRGKYELVWDAKRFSMSRGTGRNKVSIPNDQLMFSLSHLVLRTTAFVLEQPTFAWSQVRVGQSDLAMASETFEIWGKEMRIIAHAAETGEVIAVDLERNEWPKPFRFFVHVEAHKKFIAGHAEDLLFTFLIRDFTFEPLEEID